MSNLRHHISLIEGIFLSEAQDYSAIFNPVRKVLTLITPEQASDQHFLVTAFVQGVEEQIRDARRILKRSDRITWYLRLARLYWMRTFALQIDHPEFMNLFKRMEAEAKSRATPAPNPNEIRGITHAGRPGGTLLIELEHFLSLPIPAIQNTVFEWQQPMALLHEFRHAEEQWKERNARFVPEDPEDEILLKFRNGMAWVLLPRPACDREAKAMGHCGNAPRSGSTDRLLSLREPAEQDGVRGWHPWLTFVLDDNGHLTERKGRFNENPSEAARKGTSPSAFHDEIEALLRLPEIEGMGRGMWRPGKDFGLEDLSNERKDALLRDKPQLHSANLFPVLPKPVIRLGGGWAWAAMRPEDDEGSINNLFGGGGAEADDKRLLQRNFGVAGFRRGDRVLTLGRVIAVDGQKVWDAVLMAGLGSDGLISDIIGRHHAKPRPKFHPAIMTLLKHPRVKGMVDERGRAEEDDDDGHGAFGISDLSDPERNALAEMKPDLLSPHDYASKFGITKTLMARVAARFKMAGIEDAAPTKDSRGVIVQRFKDWRAAVSELGSDGAQRLAGYADGDLEYSGSERHEDPLLTIIDSLPWQSVRKIGLWLRKNSPDDISIWEDDEGEEFDPDDQSHVVAVLRQSGDFEQSFLEAVDDGMRAGTERPLLDRLRSAIEEPDGAAHVMRIVSAKGEDVMYGGPLFLVLDASDAVLIASDPRRMETVVEDGWAHDGDALQIEADSSYDISYDYRTAVQSFLKAHPEFKPPRPKRRT